MTKRNISGPVLHLVSNNTDPLPARNTRPNGFTLSLVVNEEFSAHSIGSANKLASYLEREFMRLTVDCSIAKSARVTLDYIPGEKELETAHAVLTGKGYVFEPRHHHPQHIHDQHSVSVWLEKRAH
jgi:hypothetical protein